MIYKFCIASCFTFFFSFGLSAQDTSFEITFSETYELANVILALTPYGISDEWEVQKGTRYYEEVMASFEFMQAHPLLQKANYSREKWDDYLSFRTDAFAFEVNKEGKIVRSFEFSAIDGHQPFDENLALIQDFYEKSNFHAFYQAHLPYFQGIASKYKEYFMVNEMQQFLTEEFGTFEANTKNLFVFSPLVNRMSCQRMINESTTANFSTLALSLIQANSDSKIDPEQRASDIHFLFTEMDHGFVNPTTHKYMKRFKRSFHYKHWDNNSGYTDSDCFNEYMTWAVYDLFTQRYFPQYADQLNRDWHFQNNNRGFIASNLFGKKLLELYNNRKKKERIKDFYPKILDWTSQIESGLKMPTLIADTVHVAMGRTTDPIRMEFSEPIQKMQRLDCVLFKVINGERQRIKVLDLEADKTVFFQGKSLVLKLTDLPNEVGLYGLSFNIQGRKHELAAENGATVFCPTRFFIKVE